MLDTQSPFLSIPPRDAVTLTERKLRLALITGSIAPGERLSEAEICKTYDEGRGIVRAALGRLAHAGFVVPQPRSGWKVSPISAAGLRELIMARRRLEGLLAEGQLSADDLLRIQTISDMQAALSSAPAGVSWEHASLHRGYDRQIRDLLSDRLRAPLIAGWLENLWDRSERYLNYFEKSVARAAPQFDWAPFIEAKKHTGNEEAGQILSEGCEVFARFAQASLLESDLVAPDVLKKEPKASQARPASLQKSFRGGERSSKRTI